MPYTSNESIACSEAKTILSALSGLSADRIAVGIKDITPDTEFFKDLDTNGYFVVVDPVDETNFMVQEESSNFEIEVKFYFSIPAKSDFDFLAVQDFVYATIRPALAKPSNWTTCPLHLRVSKPEHMLDIDSPAGLYVIKLDFMGS